MLKNKKPFIFKLTFVGTKKTLLRTSFSTKVESRGFRKVFQKQKDFKDGSEKSFKN